VATLQKIILSDIERYRRIDNIFSNSRFVAKIEMLLLNYGLHAVIIYRFGQYIKNSEKINNFILLKYLLLFFYIILKCLIRASYGIDISEEAVIGEGFYIGHFGNIFIGNCIIGKNCSVNQQVHIGEKLSYGKTTKILIGNNVWIGAHARINYGVFIGNGATISCGSVINSNVKDHNLVMGDPSRVIFKNYDNSSLL
jgi:serine O-acetyltransferase